RSSRIVRAAGRCAAGILVRASWSLLVWLAKTAPILRRWREISNRGSGKEGERAVQAVAIQWEILDPRKVRYLLMRSEDFPFDLSFLCRRAVELVHAPRLRLQGLPHPRHPKRLAHL